MNKEAFDKLYLGKAVHCDTEEKANHFLALADSVGYRWVSRRKLIHHSHWERHKEETCYELTKGGFMFVSVRTFYLDDSQIVEYQSQSMRMSHE